MSALQRRNISSGTRWEAQAGYSRAVCVGPHVWVAGTTAVDEQMQIVGRQDIYVQTKFIFEKISGALAQAGASLRDVVRTRMYVTDMNLQSRVMAAHAEVFGAIRPAATLIEIARLVDPKLLIEIEVDAYKAGSAE